MSETFAVGGSFGHVGSGGWDVWPLVGIVLALWLGRRLIDIPWGPLLIVVSLAAGLALPPIVHAWGIVPTGCLILVTAALIRLVRTGRRKPPETV